MYEVVRTCRTVSELHFLNDNKSALFDIRSLYDKNNFFTLQVPTSAIMTKYSRCFFHVSFSYISVNYTLKRLKVSWDATQWQEIKTVLIISTTSYLHLSFCHLHFFFFLTLKPSLHSKLYINVLFIAFTIKIELRKVVSIYFRIDIFIL